MPVGRTGPGWGNPRRAWRRKGNCYRKRGKDRRRWAKRVAVRACVALPAGVQESNACCGGNQWFRHGRQTKPRTRSQTQARKELSSFETVAPAGASDSRTRAGAPAPVHPVRRRERSAYVASALGRGRRWSCVRNESFPQRFSLDDGTRWLGRLSSRAGPYPCRQAGDRTPLACRARPACRQAGGPPSTPASRRDGPLAVTCLFGPGGRRPAGDDDTRAACGPHAIAWYGLAGPSSATRQGRDCKWSKKSVLSC
jgi:hypothetical protein